MYALDHNVGIPLGCVGWKGVHHSLYSCLLCCNYLCVRGVWSMWRHVTVISSFLMELKHCHTCIDGFTVLKVMPFVHVYPSCHHGLIKGWAS